MMNEKGVQGNNPGGTKENNGESQSAELISSRDAKPGPIEYDTGEV
jgi:hypothetical protein